MAAAKRAPRSAGASGGRAPQSYNGAIRAQLSDLQRARMLAAMFDVATERGAANVSVAHVVERSGVSRRTFYEVFEDREDCFLAAFEQALALARERVLPAYVAELKWRERVRASLIALLSFLDEQPAVGRLLIVESLGGGPRTLARRDEVVARLTRAIDEGRKEVKGVEPPPLTAEGLVGGALSVIHSRLAEQSHAPLVELTNSLVSMIVLPYLGAAAARRELERRVPQPRSHRQDGPVLSDPFKDAGMRLTYRTVMVLAAIAERPDASNRLIGERAGITDQGQISKLLARLERIGLISNTGLGPGKGAPNAWALTAKGRLITDSIRVHTPDEAGGDPT